MKINWNFLKIIMVVLTVVALYGFTQDRNKARLVGDIQIEFIDDNDPFITLETVNKLLIQKQNAATSITKETLVLKEMESRLLANDMIRDAQVFVTVPGALGAKIEQRRPVARVAGTPNYYIDEDGMKMPLSSVYTARVPLVTVNPNFEIADLLPLLLAIQHDEFMKQSVIGMKVNNDKEVVMRMRTHDFNIYLGSVSDLPKKFQNFKAFYKKAKQDKSLSRYGRIDLKFGNQVVATKK